VETQSPKKQISVGQSIVILDFGAQYTQLIARRIREQNVFSVVLPCTAKLDEVKSYAPAGLILSGAPWSVYDKDAPPADAERMIWALEHILAAARIDPITALRYE